MEAWAELDKLTEDEMRDKVVLAFTNNLTSSTTTRSSKELTDLRENEEIWWCGADGSGGDTAVTGKIVQDPACRAGLGEAHMCYANGP